MDDNEIPGGPVSNRPLKFCWVLDVSGSMAGEKIGQLNHAIREALPAMIAAANENAHARVEVQVLTFSNGARWQTPTAIPLEQFTWSNISEGGITDMGAAMELLAKALHVDAMPDRSLPPVLVLVTDGQPTDNFDAGLATLMAQPWATKAIRLGIAVGTDADEEPLRKFVDNPEMAILHANNSETLVQYIKWASTAALKAATAPNAAGKSSLSNGNVGPIAAPPAQVDTTTVW